MDYTPLIDEQRFAAREEESKPHRHRVTEKDRLIANHTSQTNGTDNS